MATTGDRHGAGRLYAGATVNDAGDVVAREVLRADAANLPPISPIAPAQEGDPCRLDPRARLVTLDAGSAATHVDAPGVGRVSLVLGGGLVRTTRERADQERQAKLEHIRQQVKDGSLVIRRMTEEERQRYPPRPARGNKVRGR